MRMNEKALKIYNEISTILGAPVYLVGGSVRDIVRGVEPKDYDFTTGLIPDEIEAKIKSAGKKPFIVGKRFGTVGVKIDGQMVEITTFRSETYEPGNRKPIVEFGQDITADLSRRDFTINAMAWREGKLIDPFEGAVDLKDGRIRAVGNPKTRFKEDPLRMLRAIRFATTFNFVFDPKTLDKIIEKSYKILEISKERWMQELDKMLVSENIVYGLHILEHSRLLHFMIPELTLQFNYDQNSPHHKLKLWEHTKQVVGQTPADIDLRWGALLHDIGKPFMREEKPGRSTYIKHDMLGAEMVERLARHLKWSNDRREKVVDLVFNHMTETSPLRKADTSFEARGK